MPAPAPTESGLPRLVPNEDISIISEVGAQPLVNDPKLGWDTAVRLIAPNDGGHTRLPSDPGDYRIRSNTKWVVLLILLVLGVAAGVAAYYYNMT